MSSKDVLGGLITYCNIKVLMEVRDSFCKKKKLIMKSSAALSARLKRVRFGRGAKNLHLHC